MVAATLNNLILETSETEEASVKKLMAVLEMEVEEARGDFL